MFMSVPERDKNCHLKDIKWKVLQNDLACIELYEDKGHRVTSAAQEKSKLYSLHEVNVSESCGLSAAGK